MMVLLYPALRPPILIEVHSQASLSVLVIVALLCRCAVRGAGGRGGPVAPPLPQSPTHKLNSLSPLAQCPQHVAEYQAKAFMSLYTSCPWSTHPLTEPTGGTRFVLCGSTAWSSCPTDDFLRHLRWHHARSGVRHVLDVGCNKGYSAANFLDMWTPHQGISPAAGHAFYVDADARGDVERATGQRLDGFGACGACDDCLEGGRNSSRHHGGAEDVMLHVHSFEPAFATHALVSLAQAHFFPEGGDPSSVTAGALWHLTRAAALAMSHFQGARTRLAA